MVALVRIVVVALSDIPNILGVMRFFYITLFVIPLVFAGLTGAIAWVAPADMLVILNHMPLFVITAATVVSTTIDSACYCHQSPLVFCRRISANRNRRVRIPPARLKIVTDPPLQVPVCGFANSDNTENSNDEQ
jgi:hypothetical protein